MQQVGLMHLWSDGGAQTTPYIMQAGYTPTENAPTRGTRALLNRKNNQFKSMLKTLL